jgi:hypothetical protein
MYVVVKMRVPLKCLSPLARRRVAVNDYITFSNTHATKKAPTWEPLNKL